MIVGFDGAQSLDLVGPFEVFGMANSYSKRPVYELSLASEMGGTIRCGGAGLTLGHAHRLTEVPRDIDTLLSAGAASKR